MSLSHHPVKKVCVYPDYNLQKTNKPPHIFHKLNRTRLQQPFILDIVLQNIPSVDLILLALVINRFPQE